MPSVIVGAGLVGSLLAITLKKAGEKVILFEKNSDMRLEELGAGRSINLIITSRGLNAVKQVGLLEDVLALTIPVTGRVMHSTSGELTYQPYGKNPNECNYSISRSELNKLLMTKAEEAGVDIIFGHSIHSINVDKDEIYLTGPNKTERTEKFQRVYGTDGANSMVRKELLKRVDDSSESMKLINADYKELFMPATKAGDYPIEKNALHIWPRGNHMLMALPNLDGSFTMTLYMPREGENSFENLKTPADIKNYFETYYADSIPLMPKFREDFIENPQGILGTVRANPWNYSDRICLLGDAAHAIVPFFGQGMNSGFEDVTCLTKHREQDAGDWKNIFDGYSLEQKPNGDAIADMAIENFNEMSEKTGDERFLFFKKVENELQKRFPKKFRSRYGMVVYTLVPYSYAQAAGLIQQEILIELCNEKDGLESIDWSIAESLIDKKLVPFQEEHGVSLDRYKH
jgi:kynurenine 3-monooxygenase